MGRMILVSLNAGVVHWAPPQAALDAASALVQDPAVSSYGPCTGLPELVGALEAKLEAENSLPGVRTLDDLPVHKIQNLGSKTRQRRCRQLSALPRSEKSKLQRQWKFARF